VPRGLMGDYLAHSLMQARDAAAKRGLALECASGVAVISIKRRGQAQVLTLSDGSQLLADQIVLTNGHLPPHPPRLPALAWGEPGLLANPWTVPWNSPEARERMAMPVLPAQIRLRIPITPIEQSHSTPSRALT